MSEDKSKNGNSAELSFPDIKVSENQKGEKRSSFSFETAEAGKTETPESSGKDILSPEFLEEEKKKWENEIKISRGKPASFSPKALIILAAVPLFVILLAAFFLIFISGEKKQEENAVSAPVRVTPRAEKRPVDAEVKKLSAESVPQVNFAEIFPEIKKAVSEKNWGKLSEISVNALKSQPENIILHEKIQNYLIANDLQDKADSIYSGYAAANPVSASAVFLAARLKGSNQSAADGMLKALKVNPSFFEAYIELGNVFSQLRNWVEAEKAYKGALNVRPDDPDAKYLFTLGQLRSGKGREALKDYETYLLGRKLTASQAALKCIWLAQHLDSPAIAEKYLEDIKSDPKYERKYIFYSMAQKAIYGKVQDADFQDWYPNECRVYHIIHLLSQDKFRDVQLLSTPPDDFPDFWKVFLAWKNDNKDWEGNASALMVKNRKSKDRTKGIIASLWLGETGIEETEGRLNDVAPESEGLLYLMLAEYCRKKNEPEKACGYYAKALKAKANPYKALIDNYSRK